MNKPSAPMMETMEPTTESSFLPYLVTILRAKGVKARIGIIAKSCTTPEI